MSITTFVDKKKESVDVSNHDEIYLIKPDWL